jgi:hypothetical protein
MKEGRSSGLRRPRLRAVKRQFVLCLRNEGYEISLTPRKVYVSLRDTKAAKHKMIRVIDESGEDYLFPPRYFARVRVPASVRAIFGATA